MESGTDKPKKPELLKSESKKDEKKDSAPEPPPTLLNLNDARAKREIESIMRRLDMGGVALEDAISLLVRAVVDSTIDLPTMQRALRSATKNMADYGEMLMASQAMRHLAAEADMTRKLDAAAEKLFQIVESPASLPSERVNSFNALVRWRKERVEYPFMVAKLIKDTATVERLADMFAKFVEMGRTGEGDWESVMGDLPVDQRRDLGVVVSWMIKAQDLDLSTVKQRLEAGLKEDDRQ